MVHKADIEVPHGSSEGTVMPTALTAAAKTIPFLIAIPISSVTAGNFDYTTKTKIQVLDAWAVHTGGLGEVSDTVQLFNGATAISDAMDWAGADEVIVRAGTLSDAAWTVAKGGTLRVTTVDFDVGGDVGLGTVFVLAVKVP